MKWQVSLSRVLILIGLLSGSLACWRLASANGDLALLQASIGAALLAAAVGVLLRRSREFGVWLAMLVALTVAIALSVWWAMTTGYLK